MNELPSGWAEAKLGDVVSRDGLFVDGDWVESKDQDPDGEVRLTQLADVGEGRFRNRSNRFLTAGKARELRCTYLEPNDVLVARMPDPLGRACLFPGDTKPCVTVVDVCIIRSGAKGVDPHWLMWWINTPRLRGDVLALQSGTTRKRISRKNLATIPFPVPPLAEQRRIVAAIEEHFSRLDAAEETLRQAQTKTSALKTSALRRALKDDWPTVALDDLAELITKGTTPTSVGHQFATSGVLFVKAESLRRGVVDHERCAYISDAAHRFLARSQLAENDLLITIAGTLGRTGVVRAKDLPANTNQAVSLTRVRDASIVPWVLTWLNGPQAQAYLTTGGRGIGLQNLNLRQIAELPVPIPPEDDQRRIVAEVERQLSLVDALAAATTAALKRSAALRRSILERAFSGKLVPQDPRDESASVLLERIRAERAADAGRASRGKRKTT